ncbi:MAG: hypothetical protein WBE12_20600, partial [Candidatus Acidiferrum sp.]
ITEKTLRVGAMLLSFCVNLRTRDITCVSEEEAAPDKGWRTQPLSDASVSASKTSRITVCFAMQKPCAAIFKSCQGGFGASALRWTFSKKSATGRKKNCSSISSTSRSLL